MKVWFYYLTRKNGKKIGDRLTPIDYFLGLQRFCVYERTCTQLHFFAIFPPPIQVWKKPRTITYNDVICSHFGLKSPTCFYLQSLSRMLLLVWCCLVLHVLWCNYGKFDNLQGLEFQLLQPSHGFLSVYNLSIHPFHFVIIVIILQVNECVYVLFCTLILCYSESLGKIDNY